MSSESCSKLQGPRAPACRGWHACCCPACAHCIHCCPWQCACCASLVLHALPGCCCTGGAGTGSRGAVRQGRPAPAARGGTPAAVRAQAGWVWCTCACCLRRQRLHMCSSSACRHPAPSRRAQQRPAACAVPAECLGRRRLGCQRHDAAAGGRHAAPHQTAHVCCALILHLLLLSPKQRRRQSAQVALESSAASQLHQCRWQRPLPPLTFQQAAPTGRSTRASRALLPSCDSLRSASSSTGQGCHSPALAAATDAPAAGARPVQSRGSPAATSTAPSQARACCLWRQARQLGGALMVDGARWVVAAGCSSTVPCGADAAAAALLLAAAAAAPSPCWTAARGCLLCRWRSSLRAQACSCACFDSCSGSPQEGLAARCCPVCTHSIDCR
jgi:hypothetical protein